LKFDYDKISSERDKLEAHLLQRVFEFEMLEKALRNINMELLKSTCELKDSKMEIISQQASINEKSSRISSLEQELRDKIHEVNVLNHSLSAKDKLFMNVIKDRDRLRDEVQNLKSIRQFSAMRQQKQHLQSSEDNEMNSHNLSLLKPPLESAVMSIGIQCDGITNHQFDYYNCSDEEDSSNPWNVKVPGVSVNAVDVAHVRYMAVIRGLQKELKDARKASSSPDCKTTNKTSRYSKRCISKSSSDY